MFTRRDFMKLAGGVLLTGISGIPINAKNNEKQVEKPEVTKEEGKFEEVRLDYLINNPDLFKNSFLYIFNKKTKCQVNEKISFEIDANYSLDLENFVYEKFQLKIPEENEGFSLLYTIEKLKREIKKQEETLKEVHEQLPEKILESLASYENWKIKTQLKYVDGLTFEELKKQNSFDEHIEKTIESDERYQFKEEEQILAEKFLEDMPLHSSEILSILEKKIRKNFKYTEAYKSYNPKILDKILLEESNCTDYAWAFAKLWNLLKTKNKNLENVHITPVWVYRYGKKTGYDGHIINAIFNTEKQEFTFVDLTSEKDFKTLKVLIYR